MAFYVQTPAQSISDLLGWPPLRVYDYDTGVQWMNVADLVYLEGEANYTWLHWADGRRLLVPYTLKRVEAQLPPSCFLRLHRHLVVNQVFIHRVEFRDNKPQITLFTGACLSVSRRRWVVLRQSLILRWITD